MTLPLAHWIPRSIFGAVLASVYLLLAVFAVAADRAPGGGGNWISLRGMTSFLTTLPVSAAMEWVGRKLDFQRNIDMAFAISVCTALIYFFGTGLGKLVQLIFADASTS